MTDVAVVGALAAAVRAAWQAIETLETWQSFRDQRHQRGFDKRVVKAAVRGLERQGTLDARAAARLLGDDVFAAFVADPDDPSRRQALSNHVKSREDLGALLGAGTNEVVAFELLAQAWVMAALADSTPAERLIAAKQDVTNDSLLHIIELGLDAHTKLDTAHRQLDALLQRTRVEMGDLLDREPSLAESIDLAAFRMASSLTRDLVPPYVPRDIDPELDTRLQMALRGSAEPLVVVVGPTKSGKSRCLLEALGRVAPTHLVLSVRRSRRRDTVRELVDALNLEPPDGPWIIIVEDLYEHLRSGADLAPAVRRAALIEPGGCIVATCSPQALPGDTEQHRTDGVNDEDVFLIDRTHVRLPAKATNSEQGRARGILALQTPNSSRLANDLTHFPELLAAIPQLEARVRRAWEDLPATSHRAALVLAAVQLALAQGRHLDRLSVRERARCIHRHLPNDQRGPGPLGDRRLDEAEAWAATRVGAAYALLMPVHGTDDVIEVLDALVDDRARDALDPRFGPCTKARPGDALLLAATANHRFDDFATESYWLTQAAGSDDPDLAPEAQFMLGVRQQEEANPEEAEAAYRQVIASGHSDFAPRATLQLGYLLKQEARFEEAKEACRDAIASGHPDVAPMARVNLANLLGQEGQLVEAEAAYREAIESRHADQAPKAMNGLAVLFANQGRYDEAEALWREVASAGHRNEAPIASHDLALLFSRQGKFQEAEQNYRDAIASDHMDQAPKVHLRTGAAVLPARQSG